MFRKLSIVLILIVLLTSVSAMAGDQERRHGSTRNGHVKGGAERKAHAGRGRFDGSRRHEQDRVGIFVESPFFWPDFYYWPYSTYSPYYVSPALITPSCPPPAYINQGMLLNDQSCNPNTWGYCLNPAGYYPYVRECSSGWLQVEPQPLDMQPGYWYYCSNPDGYYPYVRECSAIWKKVTP